MMPGTFEAIVDPANLRAAYLETVQRFEEQRKGRRYAGIDGISLRDLAFVSASYLETIQQEMITSSPLDPTLEMSIPKAEGGTRLIYSYTVKDRIKARAISRVLEPVFEGAFSPFFFSHRTTHPHYKAVRSVAKRYRRHYGQDTVLLIDVADYTGNIRKDRLCEQLQGLGLDSNTIALLELFLNNSVMTSEGLVYPEKGLVTGVGLMGLFANLYLNDLDHTVGRRVSLYRRVGDDLILMDRDSEKLANIHRDITDQLEERGLEPSVEKLSLIRSNERFRYLGYSFHERRISIRPSSVRRIVQRWKRILRYYPGSKNGKLRRLSKILYENEDSIHRDFLRVIADYRCCTDAGQIQELSGVFYRVLTRYFYGSYSHRKQRKVRLLTGPLDVPSLSRYYFDFHHGRRSLSSLAVSAR